MVIAWNHLEQTAHQILVARLGGSSEAWMVVTEMGNKAIPNALRATSMTLDDHDLIDRIDHFLTGFERLLVKRNYWIHGLLMVVPQADDDPVCEGSIRTTSAKSKFKYSEDRVTLDQLRAFFKEASAFGSFGDAILIALQGENEFSAAFREMLGKPPPSLEKPPLPDALSKNTREFPKHWLQPQSSLE